MAATAKSEIAVSERCETRYSPEFELLLASCAHRRDSDRLAQALGSRIDWEIALRLAEHHRVLPALHAAMSGRDDLPASIASAIRSRAEKNALKALRFSAELARIARSFAERGVEALAHVIVDPAAAKADAQIVAEVFAKPAAKTGITLIVAIFGPEARREAGGIAPVEVGHAIARLGGEKGVERRFVGEAVMGIDGSADTLLVGLAPALHRIGHGDRGIGCLEGDRVGALASARCRFGLVVLAGDDDAAALAKRHAAARTALRFVTVARIIDR